jgi:predicted ATP-grasp superfamily ATP-dependent carboligase
MEGVKIFKRPRLKNPLLIVGWPGMGEVAFKAVFYLVEKLKAEKFAEIPPSEYFYLTESIVREGLLSIPELPYSKLFYYKDKTAKNDLIIFLSDAQPDLAKAEDYCRRIISLAKSFKVKKVVGFAAMPQPIDHTQRPQVWFTATDKETIEDLKKYDLRLLSEGQISGLNGLFLGLAKKEGLDGFCLLGEIPLYTIQIENPGAAAAVLDVLAKIMNLKIDISPLREQAQAFEEQINGLLEHLNLGGQAPAPIGEEEIEKIKKSLSQLTKLPQSIKEKIEKLFSQASIDISKANDLKSELDKWSVYKEYEDRFLDLFKRSKEKNN